MRNGGAFLHPSAGPSEQRVVYRSDPKGMPQTILLKKGQAQYLVLDLFII